MSTEPATSNDFDMNRPTILNLLYLGGFLTGGISSVVGVILAYSWQGEPAEAWVASHYRYLIRTFWMFLAWTCVAVVGSIVTLFLLAWVLFPLVSIWFVARCIKSLLAAQKREPVSNVETWIV
jgi:uncharacterized membrane protein